LNYTFSVEVAKYCGVDEAIMLENIHYWILKNKANDILNKVIELKFDTRMDNGFKIGPKDKSFILSFTEKDFTQFLQSFLKVKTKEILFPKG